MGSIEGQFPRISWAPNPDGQRRTIEEAVEIANRHGVQIPDDVAFFVDEFGMLETETSAAGSRITKAVGEYVRLSDFRHPVNQKVPFVIRPDILARAVYGWIAYGAENGDWLPAPDHPRDFGQVVAGRVPVPFFRALSPKVNRSGDETMPTRPF